MTNYYSALGISRNASGEEIRDAYRRHVMEFHPDRNPDLVDASRFRAIQEAYEVLGNAERRKSYDEDFEAEQSRGPDRATEWFSASAVRPAQSRPPVWPKQSADPFDEEPFPPNAGRNFADVTYHDSSGIENRLRRIFEQLEELFFGEGSDERFRGQSGRW